MNKQKFLIGLASILAVLSFITFWVYQATTNAEPSQSCGDILTGDICASIPQCIRENDACVDAPFCGDGIVNWVEECDGEPDCDGSCMRLPEEPSCGDGMCNGDESCDMCIADCWTCDIPPEEPYCGDGNTDEGEQCDDGGTANGDWCDEFCQVEWWRGGSGWDSSLLLVEFYSYGETDWIELQNSTTENIYLESGRTLEISNELGVTGMINLSGMVPAMGLLTVDVTLNDTGWKLELKNSTWETANLVDYGSLTWAPFHVDAPTETSGAALIMDAGNPIWILSTPTKWRLNEAIDYDDCVQIQNLTPWVDMPPLLSSVADCLATPERWWIFTNMWYISDPTRTPVEEGDELYFELEWYGKILFNNSLNLSDQNTRSILVFLWDLLDLEAGRIWLDTDIDDMWIVSDALEQAGAQLYMYNVNSLWIDSLDDVSLESIIPKDSDTNEILTWEDIPELTWLQYSTDNSGTLIFDASHFTTFELAPFHDLCESLLEQWIDTNLDEVTASDMTSFSSLYFAALSGGQEIGKIQFMNMVDLTDPDTQTLLQNLGSWDILTMNEWKIKFDPGSVSQLAWQASLVMNFDESSTFVTQVNSPNYFEVKDADGNIITSDQLIMNAMGACEVGGVCSVFFDINHFTEFNLKPFLTEVHIESNHTDDLYRTESGDVAIISFTWSQNLTWIMVGFMAWGSEEVVLTWNGKSWTATKTITEEIDNQQVQFDITFSNENGVSGNPVNSTNDWSYVNFQLTDTDDDGRADQNDNCPLTGNDQTNSDGDSRGDACDNCPNTRDIDQTDSNDDGVWDACTFSCEKPDLDVPQAECEVLVALYDSTNWDHRNNSGYRLGNSDYSSMNTVCDRYGVSCNRWDDGKYHVSQLNLQSNNLSWSLPEDLGNLTWLQYLYFNDNALISLPESIWNLTNLQQLYLYNNKLTSLPESISWLVNLQYFYVYNNELTSLPNGIGGLINLNTFYAYNNKLTTLPESLTWLTNPYFDFYNNCLDTGSMSTGLIEFIDGRYNSSYGDWKEVQNACRQFSCADVIDVPQAQCQALVDLYDSTDGPNRINKDRRFWFTDRVCNWGGGINCGEWGGQIYELNLQSNNLVWSIPESIWDITSMTTLSLNDNQITSLPSTIWNLTGLQTFYVQYNKLTSLPESMKNMNASMDVAYNSICLLGLSSNLISFLDDYTYSYDEGTRRTLQSNTDTCDVDSDGVVDPEDNCPVVSNANQTDSDATTGTITFTKTDYGTEQDCVTQNVCLTRGDSHSLYNTLLEQEADSNNGTSPAGVRWAYGTCADKEFLTFGLLQGVNYDYYGSEYKAPATNENMCMYLVADKKYYDVIFTDWTSGQQGGGFSYQRTEYAQGDACDCYDDICTTWTDIKDELICSPIDLMWSCPAIDADDDGVQDYQDNCPMIANPDQKDSNELYEVFFKKESGSDYTDKENQDCLTDNVCLARANQWPLYNSVTQTNFDVYKNCIANPEGTEWAYWTCADKDTLTFGNLFYVNECTPPNMVGQSMCLHITDDDKYFDITFNSWWQYGDGGFSYTRIGTWAGDGIGDACDFTAPTVTKLWDNQSDYVIYNRSPVELVFSEDISNREYIENALTLWASSTPNYERSDWYKKLKIYSNSEMTTWFNDVAVNVKDMKWNTASNLPLIDSMVDTSTQVEWSGDVEVTWDIKEVMISNDNPTTITVPEDVTWATINVASLMTSSWDDNIATLPEITMNVTTSLSTTPVNVEIPANTNVTADSGRDGIIHVPTIQATSSVTAGSNQTISSVIEIWYAAGSLTFDKAVRILIPGQAGKKVGYTIDWWTLTEITTTCTEDDQTWADANLSDGGDCKKDVGSDLVIWTKHFTQFATYTSSSSTPSWGWWGGGVGPQKDICEDRDCSNSYYDKICGVCPEEITEATGAVHEAAEELPEAGSIAWSQYSQEINDAYLYAYSIGITTKPTIHDANIAGKLIRSHMAKMIVNYAINVLGKTPDNTKTCEFDDMYGQPEDLVSYMALACQLGLMGVDENGNAKQYFNPASTLTRAEFGTVLSRVLYGTANEWWTPYYTKHLSALQANDIIKNTTPMMLEKRGRVMLMLMRAAATSE